MEYIKNQQLLNLQRLLNKNFNIARTLSAGYERSKSNAEDSKREFKGFLFQLQKTAR